MILFKSLFAYVALILRLKLHICAQCVWGGFRSFMGAYRHIISTGRLRGSLCRTKTSFSFEFNNPLRRVKLQTTVFGLSTCVFRICLRSAHPHFKGPLSSRRVAIGPMPIGQMAHTLHQRHPCAI